MSEVIVRMEMPQRCFDCPMHDWTYGLHETRQNVLVCNARHELTPILCQTIPNGNERPDWCPIIGVLPEQHGRLVDANHFEAVSYTENEVEQAGYCWRSFDDGVEWLLNQIDATPTIIPATERSET